MAEGNFQFGSFKIFAESVPISTNIMTMAASVNTEMYMHMLSKAMITLLNLFVPAEVIES